MKNLANLIIADAKIMAQDGHLEPAIDNYMSLYRMGRHVNDRNLICYLVAIAINNMTNDCLIQIMSEMPQSTKNMTRLKTDLMEIESIPLSVKPALLGEKESMLMLMSPEHAPDALELLGPEFQEGIDYKPIKEKVLSGDKDFFEKNKQYYTNYFDSVIAAYDLHYTKSHAKMVDLEEKMTRDVEKDPEIVLAAAVIPATDRVFSLKTRSETYDNAIKTAIKIYLVKAKAGKLPDVLPANTPLDLFSGKPFEYEKTKQGFTLRCRQKEIGKDELHEYKFKISK